MFVKRNLCGEKNGKMYGLWSSIVQKNAQNPLFYFSVSQIRFDFLKIPK